MTISSSNSRLPAGGGRSYQLRLNDFSQITGNAGANGLNRNGQNGASVATYGTQGVPTVGTTERKGRRCYSWGSAVGGVSAFWQFNAWNIVQRDAPPFPPGIGPWECFEVRALLSLDRTAQDINDSHDMGIGLSPGNNNQNMNNPAVGAVFRAGVQFGPAGNGKVRFRSRAGQSSVGPPPYACDFDTANTAVAGFDEREWHWYAIRCVGGASNTNGVCKALLDGVLFSQVSMDSVTAKFPTPQAGIGGAFGYHCGVTNQSNGLVDNLYIAEMDLIIAPTEADF